MSVQGALIIGLSGGVLCYLAVDLIRIKMKIDDSLDVFAVHGVGGILGTILCAPLMHGGFGGVGLDEGATITSQLKVQIYAVIVTAVWTIIFSYLILKFISIFIELRVTEDQEIQGLDNSLHGESGYNN